MALRIAARRMRYAHIYRSSIKPFSTSAPAPTQEELLSSHDIQSLLKQHSKTAEDPVRDDPALRLEMLTHFSSATGRPVASDALGNMHTAAEMALWFATAVRPVSARPHARGLIAAMVDDKGGDIDDRIDRERGNVQEELMRSLPANLQLDPSTFRAPEKAGINDKRVFPKPQIQRRIVKRAKKAQREAEWRASSGL